MANTGSQKQQTRRDQSGRDLASVALGVTAQLQRYRSEEQLCVYRSTTGGLFPLCGIRSFAQSGAQLPVCASGPRSRIYINELEVGPGKSRSARGVNRLNLFLHVRRAVNRELYRYQRHPRNRTSNPIRIGAHQPRGVRYGAGTVASASLR